MCVKYKNVCIKLNKSFIPVEMNHDEKETLPLDSIYGVYDYEIKPFTWDFGLYKIKLLASTSVARGERTTDSYNFGHVSAHYLTVILYIICTFD